MWVTINGVRYPIERSAEPREVTLGIPNEWNVERFFHEGEEWETVRGITVEEAIRIRDMNRSLTYKKVGSGDVEEYDDDGVILIWCKETNLLYAKMGEDETPPKNSLTGEISEHYSEKLHAICMGKMVKDGDQWVPEDKASWMKSGDSSDDESD